MTLTFDEVERLLRINSIFCSVADRAFVDSLGVLIGDAEPPASSGKTGKDGCGAFQ
jgi:hypothetical protein